MSIARRGLMVSAMASSFAASAQDKHWLVGTWRGQLGNNYQSKDGPTRTMLIQSIGPGDTVAGGWAVNKPRVGNAQFKLVGDTLTVVTNADSQVELKRVADGRMRGQFRAMASGKTWPIEMTRE